MRRAVDLISVLQSDWAGGKKEEGMLLLLDLQKAFNSVSCSYLFAVFRRWAKLGARQSMTDRTWLYEELPLLSVGSLKEGTSSTAIVSTLLR